MLKVINDLEVFERNGKRTPSDLELVLTVKSHWNSDRKVVLEMEGNKFTVLAEDLINAIRNATNT